MWVNERKSDMTATTFRENHSSALGLLVAGAAVVISLFAISTDDVGGSAAPAAPAEAPSVAGGDDATAPFQPSDDAGCLVRADVVRC
jgi:hypothetical protein